MAKAARMKARAKKHTVKVVVKSVGEAAATNLAYGAKALGAIGTAALNDAATFTPILTNLAPQFLPQLASVASVGPAGLGNVLGNLAQSIGGALLGNSNIGVAGPDLLASRVVSMLPNDLLSSLVDAGGVGGGLSPQSLIDSIPPQILEAITGFLMTGEFLLNLVLATNAVHGHSCWGSVLCDAASCQQLVVLQPWALAHFLFQPSSSTCMCLFDSRSSNSDQYNPASCHAMLPNTNDSPTTEQPLSPATSCLPCCLPQAPSPAPLPTSSTKASPLPCQSPRPLSSIQAQTTTSTCHRTPWRPSSKASQT